MPSGPAQEGPAGEQRPCVVEDPAEAAAGGAPTPPSSRTGSVGEPLPQLTMQEALLHAGTLLKQSTAALAGLEGIRSGISSLPDGSQVGGEAHVGRGKAGRAGVAQRSKRGAPSHQAKAVLQKSRAARKAAGAKARAPGATAKPPELGPALAGPAAAPTSQEAPSQQIERLERAVEQLTSLVQQQQHALALLSQAVLGNAAVSKAAPTAV